MGSGTSSARCLVAAEAASAGWQVTYLGADMPLTAAAAYAGAIAHLPRVTVAADLSTFRRRLAEPAGG